MCAPTPMFTDALLSVLGPAVGALHFGFEQRRPTRWERVSRTLREKSSLDIVGCATCLTSNLCTGLHLRSSCLLAGILPPAVQSVKHQFSRQGVLLPALREDTMTNDPVSRVAIIGTGQMGPTIAVATTLADCPTVLIDPPPNSQALAAMSFTGLVVGGSLDFVHPARCGSASSIERFARSHLNRKAQVLAVVGCGVLRCHQGCFIDVVRLNNEECARLVEAHWRADHR